jgi:hypothetical protein
MYLMCQLSKPVDGGIARMTSWIRQAVAIPGTLLDRLEDTETGVIEAGWRVDTASGPAYPESLLMKRSHAKVFASIRDEEAARDHARNKKGT